MLLWKSMSVCECVREEKEAPEAKDMGFLYFKG